MTSYFVIMVHVDYNMRSYFWPYGEYDEHPTDGEIEKALTHFRDETYPTDAVPTIHYAIVERRYKLPMEGKQ